MAVLQERARFRRLYPPLEGSNDPHYHWRGADSGRHKLDHVLTRLTDVRVSPVQQSAQCACVAPTPPRHGHPSSCSANNAADTLLPYNPWYGSYTEHVLQALSVDDDDDDDDDDCVQRLSLIHI